MLHQDQYEKYLSLFPNDISNALKEALIHHAEIVEIKKGDILINQAKDKHKIYYIIQGSLVRYIITPEGVERAIMFHTESFLQDVGNIFVESDHSEVSYSIKANEPTTLLALTSDFCFEWIQKDPIFVLFVLKRDTKIHATSNQLQNHLIGLSSEAFYEWLIKKYGFLFQRFLSKDIASFMGVTPVWYSNIKRKIAQNKRS